MSTYSLKSLSLVSLGIPGSWRTRGNPLAEREGFEPSDPFGSPVFKTGAFVRSATAPRNIVEAGAHLADSRSEHLISG